MAPRVVPRCYQDLTDILDIRIPGRRKQPDSAWRPDRPPNAPPANAFAAAIPTQTNGDPFPTLILEVGNSQSIADLLRIRDRALSWLTAINVFVLIAYNRNATRQTDSYFIQVAHRDYSAPTPPPGTMNTYPPCRVLFETIRVNGRYPRVDNPLPAQSQIWHIPTTHLYWPEAIPTITPAVPQNFGLNIEVIRRTITSQRRP